MHRARLRKVVVHRFRRVRPGTIVEFGDDWTILLGKPASGKTTLLHVIETMCSPDPLWTSLEPHDLELELAYDDVRLNVRSRAVVRAGRSAGMDFATNVRCWSGDTTHFTVVGDGHTATIEHPTPQAGAKPKKHLARSAAPMKLAWLGALIAPERLGLAADLAELGEQLVGLCRLDDALDDFGRLSEDATVVFTDQTGVRAQALEVPRTGIGEVAALGVAAASMPHTIGLTAATSPPLATAAKLLGFRDGALEYVQREHDDESASYAVSRLHFQRADGTDVPHDRLSYGQQRLVAFLFHLHAHRDIFLADGFGEGLHHAMLTPAFDLLRGHQKIVATQSPLLIDSLHFETVEALERTFVRCEDHDGELVYAPITREDADDLFAVHRSRTPRLSERLRDRRLW